MWSAIYHTMTCLDAIIVILARPTMPCIHLVTENMYTLNNKDTNEILQNDCIPNIAKASFSSIITKYKKTVQC